MPEIQTASTAVIKAARRLARRSERARTGRFLVEGPQAVREALGHLEHLLVTQDAVERERGLVAAAGQSGARALMVSDRVLSGLAGTVTPQGMIGIAALAPSALEAALDAAGVVVVLSQVRDPGNAGTIIRTADAAGAAAVILTKGSVDPRNPKAVRASAGSLFHLPVVADTSFDDVAEGCRQRGIRMIAAAPRAGAAAGAADLRPPTALVFGSEASGLEAAIIDVCDEVVHVPIYGKAESLNLAAAVAVLSYEAARQREGARDPQLVAR
ncbi:MAG TPA: RNA methyltransferase [Egibacteraceae bacterium]|nr:RNA methyltransferase [Egibacteraceae bacterium]